MQFKKIAFFTILSLIIFSGCNSEKTTPDKKIEQSNSLPMYKLTTNNAKTLHLQATQDGMIFEEFKGKAVLLNFFATWCPPCKAEIPHLNNLREKYGKDFEIVSVLLEEGKSTSEVKKFIEEFEVKYPITNSNENFNLANAVGGVKSIPTMFMFDKSGKMVQKFVGMVPQEMLETEIQKAIK